MSQRRVRNAGVLALLVCAVPFGAAHAGDELAAYAGGSIGQSRVRVNSLDVSAHDTAWKAFIGVAGLGQFGAEAEYVDLGRPRTNSSFGSVATRATGPAVFGLFHLPITVPYLGLVAKAGLANIQQRATVTMSSGGGVCVPGLGCDGFNRSESEFAWGAGAELKANSVAVRVEFEQFRASGGSLNLGSVGFLWSFL